MFSFPTTNSEGKPQLDWYLIDGTQVARSVSVPPPVGAELWEHRQMDGTLVGKSLRVETGYGHYTPSDNLIEETEALADFWKLCEIDSTSGKTTTATGLESQGRSDQPKAGPASVVALETTGKAMVPEIDLSGVRVAAVLAFIALLASFVLLIVPGEKLEQSIAHVTSAKGPSPVQISTIESEVVGPVGFSPPVKPDENASDIAAIQKLVSERVVGGTAYALKINHRRILDGWACVISHGLDSQGMMITEPGHYLLTKQGDHWVIVEYFSELRSETRNDEEADDLMNLYTAFAQQRILKHYSGVPAGIFPEISTHLADVEPASSMRQPEPTPVREQTSGPTAQAAGDFLTRLRGLENDHALDAILHCYAEKVDYFDHGIVDRDFIRQDKNTYFSRWPTAKHEIQGNITIEGDGKNMADTNTEASYISRFELKNDDGRHLTGTTRSRFTLAWRQNHFEITAEKAELLDKLLINPGSSAMKTEAPSADAARAFIIRLRELENEKRINDLLAVYADKVMYFKDGVINRSSVGKDKTDYFQRWPIATQKILGDVYVNALQHDLYQVSYESEFNTRNATSGKTVEGRCRCNFTLRWQNGAFQVVQEDGEVLSRRESGNSSNVAPSKSTQKQAAPKTAPKPRSGESFEELTRRLNKL